ncbi:MAG TPA: DegT/DnrJ/EryC1/StrS family aminotransferase [Magnetospirillaceae bacterium]|nr:DegT/DnrJ/EryC1/StrS family aminotransferase [Magnetospirillaceae bacterium]
MSPNTDFVPFARPSLGKEEEDAVVSVLRSGWLTTGAVALDFEREFSAFVGTEYALAVNSATSGLHLALEAVGVGPGDRVVTSPYTFAATAAAARHLGAEVEFCDVVRGGYNLDPARLEDVLKKTRNVRVILPVHVGGLPCAMDEICRLASLYGCAVVEDAAHSFPSRLPVGYAGTLGDIGVFSFYATKTITTGDGGMVVTRDPRLARRMSIMRNHGIDRPVWDRYTSRTASWTYSVIEAGFKYNLPDILAAIGREQLRKAERFLEERRAIAGIYLAAFKNLSFVEPPPDGPGNAWHLYPLRLLPGSLRTDREGFMERLRDAGVGTSVHFIPLHTMPYWAVRYGLEPDSFPEAIESFRRTVSLPIWQGMGTDRARKVADAVSEAGASLPAF